MQPLSHMCQTQGPGAKSGPWWIYGGYVFSVGSNKIKIGHKAWKDVAVTPLLVDWTFWPSGIIWRLFKRNQERQSVVAEPVDPEFQVSLVQPDWNRHLSVGWIQMEFSRLWCELPVVESNSVHILKYYT